MAMTEELGVTDSYNEDILPPPEDRFTVRNLFAPSCTEPSPQSGCVVSACTCVLGERVDTARRKVGQQASPW